MQSTGHERIKGKNKSPREEEKEEEEANPTGRLYVLSALDCYTDKCMACLNRRQRKGCEQGHVTG